MTRKEKRKWLFLRYLKALLEIRRKNNE